MLVTVTTLWVIASKKARKPPFKIRQHKKKINYSYLALNRLKEIGAMYGPGAQFTYLRSKKIDCYTFEEMILSALSLRGIRVKRNTSYSGDGGLDGQFWVGNLHFLIQAKCYSGYVKARDIREFSHVCRQKQCYGLFVHTGKTGLLSRNVVDAAVEIVSGGKMLSLLTGGNLTILIDNTMVALPGDGAVQIRTYQQNL